VNDLTNALAALGLDAPAREIIAVVVGIAPALAAAIAAAAFVFSIAKQRQDAKLQRELEADRRCTSFMDLAFENLEVAYRPDYCWICKEEERSKRPLDDVRHKNFISRFLFTAEEVLEISNDQAWRNAISSQMSCHEHYFLKEMTESQKHSYSPELRKVINEWQLNKGRPKKHETLPAEINDA
jgi:hypothetical protein